MMGFSGKNGASASALGSLRQFGLIEGIGEKTRVSDLAISIFEPIAKHERIESIRQAAFRPRVFSEIHERFGNKVPSVDEPIKAFLVRERDFSPNGAKQCIETLRATVAFLEAEAESLEQEQHDPLVSEASDSLRAHADVNPVVAVETVGSAKVLSFPQSENVTHARFPLGKECYAELTIFGPANTKSFERLKLQIDLMIAAMTED